MTHLQPTHTQSLQWCHNEHDGVSNHRRVHCLLNCWFGYRSKKTSKLSVAGLCAGNSTVTGEFPTQRDVTRKMFPFDNVIMVARNTYDGAQCLIQKLMLIKMFDNNIFLKYCSLRKIIIKMIESHIFRRWYTMHQCVAKRTHVWIIVIDIRGS